MLVMRKLFFLLLIAAVPTVARAQQPAKPELPANATPEERAAVSRQHFESGMAHFQLEEWDEAIHEWEAGFRIKPVPQFLYNIAQAYRQSKRPEKALSFYQKYLYADPKAQNKAEVERHIAQLTKLIDEQKKSTSAPPIAPIPTETTQKPAMAQTQPPNKSVKGELLLTHPNSVAVTPATEKPIAIADKPKPLAVNNNTVLRDPNIRIEPVGPIHPIDPVGPIHPIGPVTPVGPTTPTNPTTTTPVEPSRGQVVGGAALNGISQVAGAATAPSNDGVPFYKKAWFWCVLGGAVVAIVVSAVVGVEVGNPTDSTKVLPMARF